MRISICIPTIERRNLIDLLNSLPVIKTRFDIETLVVGAPRPQSLEINDQIKFVESATNYASEKRNIAAENSSGDYLIFTDDDCIIDESYFDVLEGIIKDNSKVVGFAGLTNRLINEKDPLDRGWLAAGFDRFFSLASKRPRLRWCTTSNLVVRKRYFMEVGGFMNNGLNVGGEDIDFGMRLTSKYSSLISAPQLIVHHEPLEYSLDNLRNAIKKAFNYGRSEQILIQTYPQYVEISDKAPDFVHENYKLKQWEIIKYLLMKSFEKGRLYPYKKEERRRLSPTMMAFDTS